MKRIAACRCGRVKLELTGQPILASICHCRSCQRAGIELQSRSGAEPVLGADLGTAFMLFRKDRVRPLNGEAHLAEYKLEPGSSTRRVVATCCNTAMFLEFMKGHWLSIYMSRFEPAARERPSLRTMTRDLDTPLADDEGIPAYATHSGTFMWKLLLAWAAMGFRAPKIDFVEGRLQ